MFIKVPILYLEINAFFKFFKMFFSSREEILLASTLYEPPPSYLTRTDFDLKRVVEDQVIVGSKI